MTLITYFKAAITYLFYFYWEAKITLFEKACPLMLSKGKGRRTKCGGEIYFSNREQIPPAC